MLDPKDIESASSTPNPMSSAMISGVTPKSTTAGLASKVPLESEKAQLERQGSSELPGQFPQTPADEPSEFGVNPIPATSGMGNPVDLASGEKVPPPDTLTSNTISSTVKDDPSLAPMSKTPEQSFGVNPLPATGGTGNPISLQPGEKVPDPSTITTNDIHSHVTTDKESYERGQGAPQLPDVVTPKNERHPDAAMFSLPPVSKNMIPESSLPMGGESSTEKDRGPTIQSAGAGTSTAALASEVPLEPRGKAEVLDSNQMLGANPENVTGPTAIAGGIGANSGQSQAPATKGTATSVGLPTSIQESINTMNAQSGNPGAIAPTVPDVVQESIVDSATSPEAAGYSTAVQEKSEVEDELLKKVTPEESQGEPAPTVSAVMAESAPTAASTTVDSPAIAIATGKTATSGPASDKVEAPPSEPAIPPISSTDAPAITTTSAPASTSADAPAKTPATEDATSKAIDSRDISPMTRPEAMSQTQPMVIGGVGASAAPASSGSAGKSTSTPTTDKKSKRASGFFGKLKAKFGDKEKK